MRVGKSFYRSVEFKAEVERLKAKGIFLDACSQFGIGFLSCFMGGDLIEVVTYRHGCQPLKITIEGPGKYFLIERLNVPSTSIPYNSPEDPDEDIPPYHPGTYVTVHLRDNWHGKEKTEIEDLVFQTLNLFAVNQEFPITITKDSSHEKHTIAARRWENEIPGCNFENIKSGEMFKPFLAPAIFRFAEVEPMLRGIGVIWMLSDEGKPVPRKGYLQIDEWEYYIDEIPFISAARDFLNSVQGSRLLSQSERCLNKLNRAIGLLIESPDEAWVILKEIYKEGFSYYHDELKYVELMNIYPSLNTLEKEWLKTTAQSFLKDFTLCHIKGNFNWNLSGNKSIEELHALMTCNLELLTNVWANKKGIEYNNSAMGHAYRFALHGIEVPGGFQTWKPDKGEATQSVWLPDGTNALVDVYGSLAPQPAVSRLFVPHEQSIAIQILITRAFIRYADKMRKEHANVPEWHTWFRGFLYNWNKNLPHTAILNEDFNLIADALIILNYSNPKLIEWFTPMELCCQFDTITVYKNYCLLKAIFILRTSGGFQVTQIGFMMNQGKER